MNVVVLALGIVVATAVSIMAMRHYLLDRIDSELVSSRTALENTGFTRAQIDALSAIGSLRDDLLLADAAGTLPRPETVFVAVDGGGRPVTFAGIPPTARQRELSSAVDDPRAVSASDDVRDVQVGGDAFRMVGARLGDGTVVLMATSTEAVRNGVTKSLKVDLGVGGVLLVLLGVLTLLGARHRLRPLEDMVETASAIAEGDLTRRVPARKDPVLEIEQLRLALNSMLHQVESAFETRERSAAQLRRFVADASHELRTPLAAIRGYLQLYDKGMLREPAERERAGRRVRSETDRMSRLVDELLTLARLDQQAELVFREVDLSRLVRDAAEDLRVQEPGRPVTVAADGAVLVHADETGLRQVVGNLLANVRTHTPGSAAVCVSVERSDGKVRLTVADKGPGLAPEDASRIFDRFFRAGSGAGSGLGLAIVQGVVEAHGGEVTVDTAPGEGLTVRVAFSACGARAAGESSP
ncbi:HAMP domain-containing histidine kinase [Streptomyces sp. TRM66268-LWL]|uniref:histidine kinase n=1 Tax=Streptomyces polyasparticus TaxID=2767826 RepID=A0ABR7SR83_9ACTN|nr:HAMP domain-containing sensor histidine kinase [Streptomyces polyasparticus]MBC9717190.1 HAMP domain-containing histidine kinase [Streptomyces polyasparticus]